MGKLGDVLLGISTSGRSKNVIQAVDVARVNIAFDTAPKHKKPADFCRLPAT